MITNKNIMSSLFFEKIYHHFFGYDVFAFLILIFEIKIIYSFRFLYGSINMIVYDFKFLSLFPWEDDTVLQQEKQVVMQLNQEFIVLLVKNVNSILIFFIFIVEMITI